MEQLVARRAHNPKVTGSSPVPATLKEDASASFFVSHQGLVLRAHIRRGGHRFESCSRYIGKRMLRHPFFVSSVYENWSHGLAFHCPIFIFFT